MPTLRLYSYSGHLVCQLRNRDWISALLVPGPSIVIHALQILESIIVHQGNADLASGLIRLVF